MPSSVVVVVAAVVAASRTGGIREVADGPSFGLLRPSSDGGSCWGSSSERGSGGAVLDPCQMGIVDPFVRGSTFPGPFYRLPSQKPSEETKETMLNITRRHDRGRDESWYIGTAKVE